MRVRATLAAALLVATTALLAAQPPALGPGERIADGVLLYRFDDPALLTPAGPVAVQALRLDPRKITIESALAGDRVPARETVQQIAARRGAIAAVNAGFFSLADGQRRDPGAAAAGMRYSPDSLSWRTRSCSYSF